MAGISGRTSLESSSSFISTPMATPETKDPKTGKLVTECFTQIETAKKLAKSGDPKSWPKAYQIIRALQEKYPDQKDFFTEILDKLAQKALTPKDNPEGSGLKRPREDEAILVPPQIPLIPLNLTPLTQASLYRTAPQLFPPPAPPPLFPPTLSFQSAVPQRPPIPISPTPLSPVPSSLLPFIEEPPSEEPPKKRARIEAEEREKKSQEPSPKDKFITLNTMKGDWTKIKNLLKENPLLFSQRIGDASDTILHIFIRDRATAECKKLLTLWRKKSIEISLIDEKNKLGESAIDLVALCKNKLEREAKLKLLKEFGSPTATSDGQAELPDVASVPPRSKGNSSKKFLRIMEDEIITSENYDEIMLFFYWNPEFLTQSDAKENSLLHKVFRESDEAICERLIDQIGQDSIQLLINKQNQRGETPLHVACSSQDERSIKRKIELLHAHGAKADVSDAEGHLPAFNDPPLKTFIEQIWGDEEVVEADLAD